MARRRGRPPGIDSAETRERIVDVARIHFATKGFAATTVSAMAAAVDLAPSAVYHYFGGKSELYEAVFEATAAAIWTDIDSAASTHTSLRDNVASIVDDSLLLHESHPHYSDFLALVPMEARLHPEFVHLLDRRSKFQDATFEALADLGISSGELAGFDRVHATELLRSAIMGWFFESHFRRSQRPGSGEALVQLIEALAE